MRIGMAQLGVISIAAGALALAGAGWTVVDTDSDTVAAAAPLALEVERLDAPASSPSEAGRDLLSGPNGVDEPTGDNGAGELVAPDAPVELWMNRAVAADPFRPDRQPGPGYQLPWERRSWNPPEIDDVDPPEIPEIRVVGIVVPGGNRGGAALIQREGQDPRLYRVGERVAGYQLTELSADVAILDGPAGALNFMVDQPYAPQRDEDDRRRNSRPSDEERQRQREEALRQRELQRARAQVIDAIRRRTGGGGNGSQELALAELAGQAPVWRFTTGEVTWVGRGDGPEAVVARIQPPSR